VAGRRLALVVANDEYDDAGLSRLNAPAQDADALAEVLGDPGVGGFDVEVLHNATAQTVRTAVEDLFADRSFDDLLVLHFSCHGVKNAEGELFLAMKDTRPNRLASTGVAAGFVSGQMATSRAQRIALFLDCCYGGAFPRGMVVRSSGEAAVGAAFTRQDDVGEGRGRVVVTSSNAMQYAFEGGELATAEQQPSVFTGAVATALSSGEADRDGDGWVGVGELFNYVSDEVRRVAPEQTPQMWSFGQQGDILVARSRIRRVTAVPLSDELLQGMSSELAPLRFGVADLLRERVRSPDLGVALGAWQALWTMQDDDSRKVAEHASQACSEAALALDPPSVALAPGGSVPVAFSGPPLARAVTARPDAPWLTVEYDDSGLVVTASAEASGPATVVVSGPMGEVALPVRIQAEAESDVEPRLAPVSEAETDVEPPLAPVAEPKQPAERPAERPAEQPAEPSPVPVAKPRRARRPALSTFGRVALVVLGLVLVWANLPGSDEYEKAWYNSDTGGVEPRTWADPYVVASLSVLVSAVWALVRRHDAGRGVVRAAGVTLGAAAFLFTSAVVVLVEGHLTGERDWAWPVTLLGSVVVMATTAAVERPARTVRRPRRPAWLLLGAAVLVETTLFLVGPSSYNNVRGWSVLLFPVVLGALGVWALVAGDRRAYDLAGAAAVTFAAAQLFWGVSALQAMELGYYDEPGLVRVFGVSITLTLVLVVAAVRVRGRRAEEAGALSGASGAQGAPDPPPS
jgi:uncharacterized caspase-like protein